MKSLKNIYGFVLMTDDGMIRRVYHRGHSIAEIFNYAEQLVRSLGQTWLDVEIYFLDKDEEIIR